MSYGGLKPSASARLLGFRTKFGGGKPPPEDALTHRKVCRTEAIAVSSDHIFFTGPDSKAFGEVWSGARGCRRIYSKRKIIAKSRLTELARAAETRGNVWFGELFAYPAAKLSRLTTAIPRTMSLPSFLATDPCGISISVIIVYGCDNTHQNVTHLVFDAGVHFCLHHEQRAHDLHHELYQCQYWRALLQLNVD